MEAGRSSPRDLAATLSFRPNTQDGVVPVFDGRIVFPVLEPRPRGLYDRAPHAPETRCRVGRIEYTKLAVRNERDQHHVAPGILNDVLYNEDVPVTPP
jgi:hypothetical protein